ncbi:hypothetical protein OIU85_007730 [Salix viminalis]|uniref:Knottin scorpion toxin-like domain-containing protein n=1 Tax=Salix viminalis TaxID=40686 RepID=A0A9Q0P9J7_SALVM|nr:hypothetical protein OIU85_007730 [Salix viminalis]
MDKSSIKLVFLVVLLAFAVGTQCGDAAFVRKSCQTSKDCLVLGPKCKCFDHFCLCAARPDEQVLGARPLVGNP